MPYGRSAHFYRRTQVPATQPWDFYDRTESKYSHQGDTGRILPYLRAYFQAADQVFF